MIKITNLQKTYRTLSGEQERVIADLNLHIPAGSRTFITGSSGSGKSTLLRILALIDDEITGELHLNGELANHLPDHKKAKLRRDNLGFIFQDYALIPELTILENVMVPLRLQGRPRAQAAEQAVFWLGRVGLDANLGGMGNFLKKYPAELSGGQQQRVGIARALCHRPKVIVADEPTGNLDQITGGEIMALILREQQELGSTLIVVTHDLALLQHATHHVEVKRAQGQPATFIPKTL